MRAGLQAIGPSRAVWFDLLSRRLPRLMLGKRRCLAGFQSSLARKIATYFAPTSHPGDTAINTTAWMLRGCGVAGGVGNICERFSKGVRNIRRYGMNRVIALAFEQNRFHVGDGEHFRRAG